MGLPCFVIKRSPIWWSDPGHMHIKFFCKHIIAAVSEYKFKRISRGLSFLVNPEKDISDPKSLTLVPLKKRGILLNIIQPYEASKFFFTHSEFLQTLELDETTNIYD
ncbi:hypothetical protein BpHYR1_048122 [Brachionus plicatilis]|uniref:Uncharacterized protein n=1 Tax=Brachionus plicatilis TaxID=10195 RepID=A0A3M7Q7Q3_BRAPC|nr:hypothetical protein BpHYR1_048122 [Brachionus plicatilis]